MADDPKGSIQSNKGLLLHPRGQAPAEHHQPIINVLKKRWARSWSAGEFADALTRDVSRSAGACWMGKAWKKRSRMSAF